MPVRIVLIYSPHCSAATSRCVNTLHQTISLALAIRHGDWKYLDHQGSGGNNYHRSGEWGMKQFALPEKAPGAAGQLYNLKTDPGETTNLYLEETERAPDA